MPTAAHASRRSGLALALLASTQFLLVLDGAIVVVAIPSIGADLGVTAEDLSWVANAYTLTFGGFLLLGGRLADLVERRTLYMLGLALFALASLAGALATSATWLITARAAQGLGAATISPAALALLITLFPEGPERHRALGIWSALAGTGGVAGSILGGLLTQTLGWQAVLYVNVPVAAAASLLAPRLLASTPRPAASRGFDSTGAILATAGLALLVYVIVSIPDAGLAATQTLAAGAFALVLLVSFLALEARARHPLVPLRVFRLPSLRSGNLLIALLTMAMFPTFFFITLYLQHVLGSGPLGAGLGQLPMSIALATTGSQAARAVNRFGVKPPIITGLLTTAAGLAWLAQISAGGTFTSDVLAPSVIAGIGMALAIVPITIAATTGLPPEEAGLASGLAATTQQVGGTLGLAALAALAATRTDHLLASGAQPALHALTAGYQAGLLGTAVIALAAAALAALLVPADQAREHRHRPAP